MKLFGLFIVFLVSICVFFVWVDNQRFGILVKPVFNEWIEELDEARRLNLSTMDFLERNKGKGSLEIGVLGKWEIVDRRELSSFFCRSYTVKVYYSASGEEGDGARSRLTAVSAKGEGSLCLM